jgi:hypothetical protein
MCKQLITISVLMCEQFLINFMNTENLNVAYHKSQLHVTHFTELVWWPSLVSILLTNQCRQ